VYIPLHIDIMQFIFDIVIQWNDSLIDKVIRMNLMG
jgi:hypothetical protein